MKCPKCGRLIQATMVACPYCGFNRRVSSGASASRGQGAGKGVGPGSRPVAPVAKPSAQGGERQPGDGSPTRVMGAVGNAAAVAQTVPMPKADAGGTPVPVEQKQTSTTAQQSAGQGRAEETTSPGAGTGGQARKDDKKGGGSGAIGFILLIAGIALVVVLVKSNMFANSGSESGSQLEAATQATQADVDPGVTTTQAALVVHPADTGTDGYVLPYSDTLVYSQEDLAELDLWELYVARNELFARHGYIFGREDLQEYFGSKSWYVPLYDTTAYYSMEDPMNDIERQNVDTIYAIEQAQGSPYI